MKLFGFVLISVLILPIFSQDLSVSVGGILSEVGNLLDQTISVDSNTFLTGATAASLLFLKAPFFLLLQIGGKIMSIVALSYFITYLGDEIGYDSPFPLSDDRFLDDSSFSDSFYDDGLAADKTIFVQMNPNNNRRQSNFLRGKFGRSLDTTDSQSNAGQLPDILPREDNIPKVKLDHKKFVPPKLKS